MKQELIWELMKQAGELAYEEHKAKCLKEGLDPEHTVWSVTGATVEKFTELIVGECIGILETEIELVKGYKSTAHNDFDVRWHDGKIVHFTKLIEKSKKHFGVEE